MKTIEDLQAQLERILAQPCSSEFPHYRIRVSLLDKKQRKKRKNASADYWTPLTGGKILLSFEPVVETPPEKLVTATSAAPPLSGDTSLLIARTHLARASGKMIMGAQLDQPGMKMNGIPMPFKNNTAKIVVQKETGNALPVFKCANVTAKETLHALIEEELKVQRPRIGKRDYKTGKSAAGAANGNFPKMRPVNLPLLSWKSRQAKKRFPASRTDSGNEPPQLHDAAVEATVSVSCDKSESPAGSDVLSASLE